jgi:hypothetical protein
MGDRGGGGNVRVREPRLRTSIYRLPRSGLVQRRLCGLGPALMLLIVFAICTAIDSGGGGIRFRRGEFQGNSVSACSAPAADRRRSTPRQDLSSWIHAYIRMREHVQGSPAVWVPDNLKRGVTRAHRCEPEINRTSAELAQHDGAVVIPLRSHRYRRDRGCRSAGDLVVKSHQAFELAHVGRRHVLQPPLDEGRERGLPAQPLEFRRGRFGHSGVPRSGQPGRDQREGDRQPPAPPAPGP